MNNVVWQRSLKAIEKIKFAPEAIVIVRELLRLLTIDKKIDKVINSAKLVTGGLGEIEIIWEEIGVYCEVDFEDNYIELWKRKRHSFSEFKPFLYTEFTAKNSDLEKIASEILTAIIDNTK